MGPAPSAGSRALVRATAKRRARLVDRFLLKPASASEIKACVRRALARRA